MIRVHIYMDEEWRELSIINKKHEFPAREPQDYFQWNMLDIWQDEPQEIPFRDEASLQFLKESYDISFVSDTDWFRVDCEGRQMDITCLNKSVKMGLVAIELSKKGVYTQFEYSPENVWRALANLPMDIKIAMRISEMGIHGRNIEGISYIIENYPYKNKAVEVIVKDKFISHDDFYTPVPEYKQNNTSYGLHVGKDGKYYSDWMGIEDAFTYHWRNDIAGIIERIERMRNNNIVMGEIITREFTIFELGELIGWCHDRNSIMMLDYVACKGEKGRKCKRCKCCKGRNPQECFEEYLFFRDKYKVISHLRFAPEMLYRKLPVMMVDKYKDGTYIIQGTLSVKNPTFSELFYDIIESRSPERERFVLVVDVEELLDSADDIRRAVCGFKVLDDSLEVFDSYEGTQLFGKMLKEAYYSDACQVDNGFY